MNTNATSLNNKNCPFSAADNESQTNKFIECLEDCFLFQCVCEPTFQIANYKSTNILDLIITNDKNKIVSITHSAPLGNVKQGHHLLKCCYLINDYKFSTENKKSIRLYQKGNYELFSCHFNNVDWENGFKSKSINEMYDLFLYHYNYATNLFIPRIDYQNRRNRNKWITPELKHKIRTKNNIWLANKRNGWNEESTKIHTLASKLKSNPKLLYKYINEKKSVKTHIRALEIDNGEIINDQFAIATELNKYFHSVYVNDNCTNIIEFQYITSNLLLNTVLITQNDVQTRLQALDKSKSVSFDFVHPYVLKECSSSISYPLYLIFKKSMETGTLPDMWKKANVMPLFKKGSKLKASNYRPVSLTSIPCKVLERIIADCIMQHLIKNNLLSKKQHGFMKSKSCTTNLLEYLDILTDAFHNRTPVDALYTDFKKAFDSVSHKKLLSKLLTFGISANRKQRVVLGKSVTDWVDVLSGVPQGFVLGPLFFLVFINDLPENFINECRLYADDNKIIAPISSQNDSQLFQNDMNKLDKWSTKWKLGLNLEKCKIMHFGSNNNEYSYFMNDNNTLMEIEKSKLEKDIGVDISTWSPYYTKDINELEKVQRRATKMIPELRHLEYKQRLEILGLTTLETRRLRVVQKEIRVWMNFNNMFNENYDAERVVRQDEVLHLQNNVNALRRAENNHQRNERNRLRRDEVNRQQNVRRAVIRAEANLNLNLERLVRRVENNHRRNERNRLNRDVVNYLQNERNRFNHDIVNRHQNERNAARSNAIPDWSYVDRNVNDNFLKHIRNYNACLCFAYFKADVVQPINHGPPCFKIFGQIYHCVGNLRPDQDIPPKFSQLYIYDPLAAVNFRMQQRGNDLCLRDLMFQLQTIITEQSPFALAFKNMAEVEDEEIRQAALEGRSASVVKMSLLEGGDRRRYILPSHDEVAVVFVGEDGAPPASREVIIYPRGRLLKIVSSMSANLDPMVYPLFFPRGDAGWHNQLVHNPERATLLLHY
ncbi:uncharacterized protein LOC136073043 [Hydra vulgaris]|uniref:uncharacterized protein LOC136073043 n=1 Tax=Hydra vulgaris TaxID=6087 RepID=UPI0032E9DC6D